MENNNSRFIDPGLAMYDIATHFVVQCPKCNGKALVKPKDEGSKLICTVCFHTELPGHFYGRMTAYVSAKCRECYEPLTRSAVWNGQWKKLAMKCEHCGDECEYEASISKHSTHNGLMCDPVFGLYLWLQAEFEEHVFWAFHYEHLELLKDYISAKHRERGIDPRNTIKKNSAIFSRLPGFIMDSKHRTKLLNLISDLMSK